MSSMKNAEFSGDWLTGLTQIVRDPQLYELLKYCPLDIMQRWRVEEILRSADLPSGRHLSAILADCFR